MVTTNKERITQVYKSGGFTITGGDNLVISQGGEDTVVYIPERDIDAFIECVTEVRDEIRNGATPGNRRGQRPNRPVMTNVQTRIEPLTMGEMGEMGEMGVGWSEMAVAAMHDPINEVCDVPSIRGATWAEGTRTEGRDG